MLRSWRYLFMHRQERGISSISVCWLCSAAVSAVNWVRLRSNEVELRMETDLARTSVGARNAATLK